MKACELRIGNVCKNRKNKIIIVDEIVITTLANWERLKYSRTPPIKPFLLSDELFLKFGFKSTGSRKTYGKMFINCFELNWVRISQDEYGIFSFIRNGDETCEWRGNDATNIKTAHQLQNLYFALTGQELEFKPNGRGN